MRTQFAVLSFVTALAGCSTDPDATGNQTPSQERSGGADAVSLAPVTVLVAVNRGVILSMQTPGLRKCNYPTREGEDTSHFKIVPEAGFHESERLSSDQLRRQSRAMDSVWKHNQELYRMNYEPLHKICPDVELQER
ncbi:hypothetical protein [Sphingobium sp.]|uniref:hypothetical protein n=1 Tax=Sphingobium sp. TaxID=1912891 RepID=UPI00257AAE46|nr:hypothetical protein [Sphingobium sp.]